MKRVCAWCKRPLNSEPDGGKPVSHGICDRCFKNVIMKLTLLKGFHGVMNFPAAETPIGNLGAHVGNSPA
jgi:hypothetical protein